MERGAQEHLGIYALYLALTVFIALPSILEPARILFGFHGDALLMVFWLWWFKIAWLRGLPADPNPLVAAPFGAESGRVIEWGSIVPGVLLSTLVNETFAFNVLVLVSFPLSAMATYHLVLRLTRNRLASAVAGFIFAFCPYHLWKAWAWIPLANTQWIPLYMLALLDLRRTRRLRYAILAGVWFGINFIGSYIYGFVLGVLTALYLLYAIIYAYVTRGRVTVDRQMLGRAAVVVAISAALIVPVTAPIFAAVLSPTPGSAPYKSAWPLSHLYELVATPADYFFPDDASWLRPLFTTIDPPDPARGDFTHGLFIGYSVMALCACAAWAWWRQKKAQRQDDPAPTLDGDQQFAIPFFGVLFVVALAISMMPPTIEFDLPGLGHIALRGPGYFTYTLVPWFREYARLGVLVMLAAAVLAGWATAYILEHVTRHSAARAFFLGALALALSLDYGLTRPVNSAALDTSVVPEVYRWLAEQPGDFIIAEYPVPRASQVSPNYLFYVTVHGKRLVNGNGLSYRSDLLMPALWDLTDQQAPAVLNALGVEYVIVHRAFPGFNQWYGGLAIPASVTEKFEVVRQFDMATVLRVHASPAAVIAAPDEGMTLAPDQTMQVAWWWIAETAALELVNVTDETREVEVQFTLTGFGGATGLDVFLANGAPVSARTLEGTNRVSIGPLNLPPSHLRARSVPETTRLILRVTGEAGAGVGLRDFQVLE
jgi:hypothetical protein